MLKQIFLVLCVTACLNQAGAQPVFREPDGGGYKTSFETATCLSHPERLRIDSMLARNIAALLKHEKTLTTAKATTRVSLAWPLKQAAGFHYDYLYAISNYVDHDLSYPNHVLDWNCGSHTYDDASGYNHAGTDIFIWPYAQNMMAAGQAEIVAAAPGIIIGKDDGNFDESCAMNGGQWNAVYVQHSDSTVAWYGHMKKNSLTTKNVGDPVAQGEFLGLVGSSGNSTGPHLHFELHDKNGQVVDPFSGNCNNIASYWQTQKPYYESVINVLMTHSAAPVMMACPGLDSIKAKDSFALNDPIIFAAYFHDQQAGQNTVYTVTRPDGSVFKTWQYAATNSYVVSYRYWSDHIPADAPKGFWQFKAANLGKSYVHPFFVMGVPTGISSTEAFSGSLLPNPANQALWLRLPEAAFITLRNMLGQVVLAQEYQAGQPLPTATLQDGLYLLELRYHSGRCEHARFQVAHRSF
ncbi:MAG: peptidoglycan DD-metalloendopeptidase family protein [Bacteroidetes bacterium]|nr:peptidoglycan DD-metalloendopeptidase family protein [Bacteroidota bacterium]MBS1628487.1 peptidoglycan DD-metalloendopeptidase family protein [Bacteroidota bacterium]